MDTSLWVPSLGVWWPVSHAWGGRPGTGTAVPQGTQLCSSWGRVCGLLATIGGLVLGSWFTATSCLLARPQPHSSERNLWGPLGLVVLEGSCCPGLQRSLKV